MEHDVSVFHVHASAIVIVISMSNLSTLCNLY